MAEENQVLQPAVTEETAAQTEQLQPEAVEDAKTVEPQPEAVEDAKTVEPQPEAVEEAQPAAEVVAPAVEAATPVVEQVEKKPKKKVSKKALIAVLSGVVAVALIAFCVVFFMVIQPNNYYNAAVEALEDKDFVECQRLIDKIPNHEGTPKLRQDLTLAQAQSYVDLGNYDQAELLLTPIITNPKAKAMQDDITYLRAKDAAAHDKIDEAKEFMAKIPDHEDPDQVKDAIKYSEAKASLEAGDYTNAYTLFSELGEYKDAAEYKESAYYEALAFRSLFVLQKTLKNPASLRISEIEFYDDGNGDVDLYAEITASNSYGGNVTAYAYDLTVYNGDPSPSMISDGAFADPDTYSDVLHKYVIIAIREQTVMEVKVDVARMNRLLKDDISFKIDIPFEKGDEVVN